MLAFEALESTKKPLINTRKNKTQLSDYKTKVNGLIFK